MDLPSSVESLVVTNKLTKKFGDFTAVDALDLDVRQGEIFGFLGPNGAGKSTTIRMLLGLIRPTSGSATIFGKDIRKHGTEIRREIGYLPGELAMYENLTPRQFFKYSASLYGAENIDFAIELSARMNIQKLDEPIGDLSQGNKQKVGIVQALLHRPHLVILDEPTNALDPLIRHELYDMLLLAKSEGMTIFFSSHVLAEAERICDRVAIIRDGRLTRVGAVEELKALAPKRIKIAFEEYVPVEAFQAMPGVTEVHANGGRSVELLVRSGVDEVVKVAAQHQIADLYSEDMTLEEIFLGYYQVDGAARNEA